MHFALPPRKSSQPPPYARSSHASFTQRRKLQYLIAIICGALALIWFGIWSFSDSPKRPPPDTPEVIVVTVIEPGMSREYVAKIKENRENYVARHGMTFQSNSIRDRKLTRSNLTGYQTFFSNATDYNVGSSPVSWSLIPAVRHAMTRFPHSTFFFSLSPHALIMNPTLSLTSHIMAPKRIESLMLKDKAVVPPDSVIHTFSHLKGDRIDLVLTQDGEGLCQESFIIRQGEWGRFFLDIWFDPLYRSYNFQKAEGHALVKSLGYNLSLKRCLT